MNTTATPPPDTASVDQDLAEQARPGYGIPSQDLRPGAKSRLEPEEAGREANSVLMGGGVVAGMAAGAGIGVVVAGPVGGVVGGTLGAVAGALGGAAAGTIAKPEDSSDANAAAAHSVRLQVDNRGGATAPACAKA
jgi:hypothetical protein